MAYSDVIVVSALSIATLFDVKMKKVPNFFNLFLLIFAVCFSYIIIDVSYTKIIFCFFRGAIIAYPLYYFNVLGAGDVKLLMCISLFLSLNNWLMLILISILISGVFFLIRLLIINELGFKTFHYYRYTHFFLWAYFILLILFKN